MNEILGYKLIKSEYKEAAISICGYHTGNGTESFSEFMLTARYGNFAKELERAGVLDLWFEPVYKQQYKVGDYVLANSNMGAGSWTEQVVQLLDKNVGCSHGGVHYSKTDFVAKLKNGRTYNINNRNIVRKATEEEIREFISEKLILSNGKSVTIYKHGIWLDNVNQSLDISYLRLLLKPVSNKIEN